MPVMVINKVKMMIQWVVKDFIILPLESAQILSLIINAPKYNNHIRHLIFQNLTHYKGLKKVIIVYHLIQQIIWINWTQNNS